jgi:hypothetical protein
MAYLTALALVCAVIVAAYLYHQQKKPLPSRADMLKDGGLYPIPIPLGWKIIDEDARAIDIPEIPGDPFHRVLWKGGLLATEAEHTAEPEVIALDRHSFTDPLTPDSLGRYADYVMNLNREAGRIAHLTTQQIGKCMLSNEPCGKIVIERTGPTDTRVEIRWLLRDATRQGWELGYLVRRSRLKDWAPLFAEIDGPGPSSDQSDQ